MYLGVVRLSVSISVTLVHPAKVVARNEMPFGRDNRVAPSSTVLDEGPGPPREGEICGSKLPIAVVSHLRRAVNIFTSIR